MQDKTNQKRRMVRYLLAEMPEDERSDFEDRFFEDSDLFEELIAVEDEMLRSYVRGSGSKPERAGVARRYLSTPQGRRRVELAKSLMEYVSSVHASHADAGKDSLRLPTPSDEDVSEMIVFLKQEGASTRSGKPRKVKKIKEHSKKEPPPSSK